MMSKVYDPSKYNTGDALMTFSRLFVYLINEAGDDLEKKTDLLGAYRDLVNYISTAVNNKPKYISQDQDAVRAFADFAMIGCRSWMSDKKSGKGLTIDKVLTAASTLADKDYPIRLDEESQALAKMAYMREDK